MRQRNIIYIVLTCILLYILYNNNIENFQDMNYYIPSNNANQYSIKPDAIFISIATYRDDECPLTIKEIYSKAKKPENIYIGICQQNGSKDIDCYTIDSDSYSDNIRKYKLDSTYAKGPTYARFICSTMWEGEEYFMQIDIHTKFVENWDVELIEMLNKCPSLKSTISCYPIAGDQKDLIDTHVPYTCRSSFNSDNMIVPGAALISKTEDLRQVPFMSAGFFFLRGDFLKTVPFDPYLPYLFHGEEILFSARLWTHGYDFYCPTKNICIHHYGRNEKPKFWNDHSKWKDIEKKSLDRAKYILNWLKLEDLEKEFNIDIEQYGLGKERTIDEYHKFAGVDFENKKGEDFCSKTYIDGNWK